MKAFKKNTMILGLAALSLLASGTAAAVKGLDKITITKIHCVKPAGAVSDAVKNGALVTAALATGGSALVLGTGAALSAMGPTDQAVEKLDDMTSEDDDNLMVQLMSVLNPTGLKNYMDPSTLDQREARDEDYADDKRVMDLNAGDIIYPGEGLTISALSIPEKVLREHHNLNMPFIAMLQLTEKDRGLGHPDDDLGSEHIQSVARYYRDHPDRGNKTSYSVTDKKVEARSDEDGSIYLVSYKVEADKGSCADLGVTGKAIYKAVYKKDCG